MQCRVGLVLVLLLHQHFCELEDLVLFVTLCDLVRTGGAGLVDLSDELGDDRVVCSRFHFILI